MKVEHNISRLKHLLKMYKLSVSDFLSKISDGLKRPISEKDVFSERIEIGHLKRIDKLFEKGIHYYLDPKAPENSKEASVFFRKENFGTDLNFRAKKIVSQFEELKISISAIAKLAELDTKRKIPKFSIKDNPEKVANEFRKILYPSFTSKRRDFLKALISKFAESNILVFEFVETHNRKEKANIDGFFLKPNVIVLKRHQSFRREIFTLAHELGHFLLNKEEIELLDYNVIADKHLSSIERWCNDFAYYFLVGEYGEMLKNIEPAKASNDYHFDLIKTVSENTHLSQIALFTRLLFKNQISQSNYNKVRNDFEEQFKKFQEEKDREKELQKEKGIKIRGSVAQPISSPLFISTIQAAFYEGIINEYDVCKKLNIKPEKLDKFIQ
ncbi:MAG: ImmA/IrrE family metallo-endopeptidase [Algibacter sp.]|uniref:ImmA/IrrE family metallo-endopeptidase n=1 Tax=Algibacter sp. TaxID=1872428 RepID=UPI0026231676|nr:ImmA/IrrE family metallo-endopeptidase [Algibacter sp.]MDG1730334.1 ImmA/IrrE family metallo-endopeptidase [Algibacter sp.]MDG2178073.1 ImmA/IrrE family metallo-endopeptidase [Algibacter sp.]